MQYGGGKSDAGELGNTQVSDDGGVRQQEQRLRDQRPERGNGKAEDFPPVGAGRQRCWGRGWFWHGTTLAALPASYGVTPRRVG